MAAADNRIPASLTLPATDSGNSLADSSTVMVDTAAPVITSAAATNANTIVLTASEPLAGTTTARAFDVPGNNIAVAPVILRNTITIAVDTAIEPGDTPTISYSGSTITDIIGNTLAVFDPLPVATNGLDTVVPTVRITSSTVPDDGGLTTSHTISYTAVFSENVTYFDDAADDIMVTGTADATVSTPTGTGNTYDFTVTISTEGTVIVSIPAGAAEDVVGNDNTASAPYTVTVRSLSQISSVELPANGYRHNLVHLTGNYYVSSHTVTAPDTATTLDSAVTLRLYSIINGNIKLIESQVIQNNAQDSTTALHERNARTQIHRTNTRRY